MSEYESVQKGSLKLKGVADSGIKKKKKRKKDKSEKNYKMAEQISDKDGAVPGVLVTTDKRTRAEIAFARVQEQRKAEEILEKAGKTHKDRITEFNDHLDNLSEHYDIPKVSWTK